MLPNPRSTRAIHSIRTLEVMNAVRMEEKTVDTSGIDFALPTAVGPRIWEVDALQCDRNNARYDGRICE